MELQDCKTLQDYTNLGIFDKQQLFIIEKSIEANITTQIVANPEYTYAQMAAIAKLLKEGKDVKYLAKYIYKSQHIPVIVFGINNDLNVALYANPQYTHNQMWAIADGLYAGIDTSDYAKVTTSAKEMYEILHTKLKSFLDIYGYDTDKFNGKQLTIISHGIKNGLEVYKYDKADYSYKLMGMIVICLERGLDVDLFLNKGLNEKQMQEVYLGLISNVDVSSYATPEFSNEQMMYIREIMERNCDIQDLLDPKITVEALKRYLDIIKTGKVPSKMERDIILNYL